jgi:RsmE family RNA methyltransferase
MNLILLQPEELGPDGGVVLRGRRARHIREVHRAEAGRVLRAGVVGAGLGEARVLAVGEDTVRLAYTPGGDAEADARAAARPPVDLLLAVPRPKVLRRVLRDAAALGVGRILLTRSWRVDKSYLGAADLAPERMQSQLLRGLEMAGATRLPDVRVSPLFKPFVEDELPGFIEPATRLLLAEPGATRGIRDLGLGAHTGRVMLAVGPERGWIPYEVEMLARLGFTPFHAGRRTLRVEAAVVALLAQIGLLLDACPRIGQDGWEHASLQERSLP